MGTICLSFVPNTRGERPRESTKSTIDSILPDVCSKSFYGKNGSFGIKHTTNIGSVIESECTVYYLFGLFNLTIEVRLITY